VRTLIFGGARSGKSRYAEQRARASGLSVVVIATGEARDEEMRARIELHKADRDSAWRVVEEPRDRARALRTEAREGVCVIVDCLTLWLSNHLTGEDEGAEWSQAKARFMDALRAARGEVLLVANEVGLGLVPETPLGREFRDEAGRLNQDVAALAERAVFVAAGLPLTLKGA
jgi:adenosylcobinamide kinase/adenosylcobinamide-phosphate guanylyltransferase